MMGMRLELRASQECSTCRGEATGSFVERPRDLGEQETFALGGCFVLGVCPSCSRSGLTDAAMATILRRLDRPRAPMRFSRVQIEAARKVVGDRSRAQIDRRDRSGETDSGENQDDEKKKEQSP